MHDTARSGSDPHPPPYLTASVSWEDHLGEEDGPASQEKDEGYTGLEVLDGWKTQAHIQ